MLPGTGRATGLGQSVYTEWPPARSAAVTEAGCVQSICGKKGWESVVCLCTRCLAVNLNTNYYTMKLCYNSKRWLFPDYTSTSQIQNKVQVLRCDNKMYQTLDITVKGFVLSDLCSRVRMRWSGWDSAPSRKAISSCSLVCNFSPWQSRSWSIKYSSTASSTWGSTANISSRFLNQFTCTQYKTSLLK